MHHSWIDIITVTYWKVKCSSLSPPGCCYYGTLHALTYRLDWYKARKSRDFGSKSIWVYGPLCQSLASSKLNYSQCPALLLTNCVMNFSVAVYIHASYFGFEAELAVLSERHTARAYVWSNLSVFVYLPLASRHVYSATKRLRLFSYNTFSNFNPTSHTTQTIYK